MTRLNGEGVLPDGWRATNLGAIATLSKEKVDPRDVPDSPYVGLEHIESAGTLRVVGRGRGADVKSTKSVFHPGDVLYGKLRPYLNKVAVPDFEGICSTDILVLRRTETLDTRFLAKLVSQPAFVDFAHQASNGVELPRVNWKALSEFKVALPPLDEQRRAAAWLDEIDVRQALIADRLSAARTLVDRLRTAVVAAACSGRLTTDWRDEDAYAGSRDPTEVPDGSNDLHLPEFPATYSVTTVGAVSERIQYGTSKKANTEGEVPVLRMGNIQEGRLYTNDLKFLPRDAEVERLLLKDGDLLFNRTNSPDLVGKSAVFHGAEPATFASYLIRVRFQRDLIEPDFVSMWLNSAWGRAWARHVKTDGVSQSNINGKKLAAMPLPVPPIDEQREIVARATAALATADRLTAASASAQRALEGATRGALAIAFRGGFTVTDSVVPPTG